MEYGWMMLRSLGVLVAVCALAYAILRWGLHRFAAVDGGGPGRLQVVERLGVAPKQTLLVVRAGREYWLVASSEAGLQMLGQLDPEQWRRSDNNDDRPSQFEP